METISLRDAGRRLAKLTGSREPVACGKLLSLLKSGKLQAGFQFSLGDDQPWIKIPAGYWTRVSTDKFKVIRYIKNRERSGAFKIKLRQFRKEVVAEVHAGSDKALTV